MSAAMHMKGFGGRVVVLERLSPRMFPRYHSVCGEAVSDRMFSKVGLEPTAVVRRVDRIEIAYPGGVTIDIPVRGSVVDRPAMLSEMKGRCDAEFLHGTATRVSQEGDGFLVETTAGPISCRFLIGADGAHSVVRRDVFGSDPAMLPVVNNARASARKADCLNNQKQTIGFITMAKNANNDIFVSGTTDDTLWAVNLYDKKYIQDSKSVRCPAMEYTSSKGDTAKKIRAELKETYGAVFRTDGFDFRGTKWMTTSDKLRVSPNALILGGCSTSSGVITDARARAMMPLVPA